MSRSSSMTRRRHHRKLASELGVGVGDSIEIYDQSMVGERDGAAHEVVVSGITEYYTGQGVFMSPEAYEAAMGEPAAFTKIICKAEAPLEERTALSNELLDVAGVEVVSFYDEVIETYRTMLRTVNAVVWVLIIAAALLAFVVLYNLTNINITERTREIATLKVLGFTPRETNGYIFRETILLTIIGAARRLRARHRNGELRRGDGRGRRDDVRTRHPPRELRDRLRAHDRVLVRRLARPCAPRSGQSTWSRASSQSIRRPRMQADHIGIWRTTRW